VAAQVVDQLPTLLMQMAGVVLADFLTLQMSILLRARSLLLSALAA
jgi:hypothetical protein